MEYGFGKTKVARDILGYRYLSNDESPEELLWRVAKHIASVEDEEDRNLWAEKFFEIMEAGRFLPNSPCLANAGLNNGNGLFACFVIGMEDNLNSISKAKSDAMAITKSGGGWGINIGTLRPRGSRVRGSTHGIAGGPIGFLETFSYDARTMTQGGFRDAACMATMYADHPDIEEFIGAKEAPIAIERLLNLNKLRIEKGNEYSVAQELIRNPIIRAASETYLSNFNMSVLATDEFMKSATLDRRIELKFNGETYGEASAASILLSIANGAWANGEPGLLFIDRIKARTKYNPDEINSTNPCGEQALPPNGSCCLGSINLATFVENGEFNFDMFNATVHVAVRFLDNMIDANTFPTKETEEWSKENRAIGLGVMGYSDMLVLLGIGYGSSKALDITAKIAASMKENAYHASRQLLDEKGGMVWHDGLRNRAITTIAPTGSISILAGCSSGIEPIYSDKIKRVDTTGTHTIEHPLRGMENFVTLGDVPPKAIIETVALWSKYIDNSISYTVNVQKDASIEDVMSLILYAWKKGCNGITIYRDGSRELQVLHTDMASDGTREKKTRGRVLHGKTIKTKGQIDDSVGSVYVTLNYDDDGTPFEIFVNTPYINSMKELQLLGTATRLVSLSLRHNVPLNEIVDQLSKIEGQSLTSIPAIIMKVLNEESGTKEKCPDCDQELEMQGGCKTCNNCGYSKC